MCGKNITLPTGNIIPASDVPCHQIESFYTWHPLKGINLDVLMLFIDGLLYFLFIGNQTVEMFRSIKGHFSVLVETRVFFTLLEFLKGKIPGYYKYTELQTPLDEDVVEEQQRINGRSFDSNNDVLKVYNLEKKFRK